MRPLFAYYGDDFTGSTDVMEVLQWSGLRTVLFMSPPTQEQLTQFNGLRAFGIAGSGRSMSAEQMQTLLPSIYQALKQSQATFVHYKTCSTFDSSPHVGSIGKAIEVARDCFGPVTTPVIVGVPHLGRFQAFGNLFARSGVERPLHRLDRHPTMAQHPVTPMTEADLRRVLAAQTNLSIELIDLLDMDRGEVNELAGRFASGHAGVMLMDVLNAQHLSVVGRVLGQLASRHSPQFVAGSSGVVAALTSLWKEQGIAQSPKQGETFAGVERLLVFTGSCSPITARQIDWAESHGFQLVAIQTPKLVHDQSSEDEVARVVDQAIAGIDRDANVLIHSSRGAGDNRTLATVTALQSLGLDALQVKRQSGQILGPKFGCILQRILRERPLPRIGIAGGDTSGYIVRALEIEALEAIAPFTPGVPLCRAYARGPLDGLELVLKGGQVGPDDIWTRLLTGTQSLTPSAHAKASSET